MGSTSNLVENDSVLYDQLEEGSVIQLLFDEIKVIQGITYNTTTNKVLGFAKCVDIKKLMKAILKEDEEIKLTSNFNHWGGRTTKNTYVPLSFFL